MAEVALVTGGGAGIGRGVAVSLAQAGLDVVVADVDAGRAAASVAAVEACGRRGLAVRTDVMDTDQVRAAVAAADEAFGRLDVLVNNAGGVRGQAFLEQSERSWRRHIDLNLVSVLAATSAAAPVMIRGGRGGSIVNVVSIEADRAAPTYAVYAACKAGVVNFTRTMAVELSEHGIRVNAIAPDWTRTPGTAGEAWAEEPPPDVAATAASYVPLGRQGAIDECGDVVAFLCSPAARYVTGAVVPVDGGTWAAGGWHRSADGGWSLH
jgi:NAD(P)-dependent dehydrogenase (short-subunit alcohol dehydrogenase family)